MFILQVFMCVCLVGAFADEISLRKWFLEKAVECSQHHDVDSEEMKMLKDHKFPESNNAKCLMACVFRKAEWIDENGMFHEENAFKRSLQEFPNNTEKLESAKKVYGMCKHVNDETVSDGAKGCERASLLATCLVKNAGEHGFLLV